MYESKENGCEKQGKREISAKRKVQLELFKSHQKMSKKTC